MKQQMANTIGTLRAAYIKDNRRPPAAFRIHPEDWYTLISETNHMAVCNVNTQAREIKFMGMVPLIDPKWQQHFPVCLGTREAAEAIEGGAQRA